MLKKKIFRGPSREIGRRSVCARACQYIAKPREKSFASGADRRRRGVSHTFFAAEDEKKYTNNSRKSSGTKLIIGFRVSNVLTRAENSWPVKRIVIDNCGKRTL